MQNTAGIDTKTGQTNSASPKDTKEAKKVASVTQGSAHSAGANSEPAAKKEAAQTSTAPNSGAPQPTTRSSNANGTASKKDLKKQQQIADEAAKTEAATPAAATLGPTKATGQAGAAVAGAEPTTTAQPKELYCICRTPDEAYMICCDRCEEWYHFHCVGIKPVSTQSLSNSISIAIAGVSRIYSSNSNSSTPFSFPFHHFLIQNLLSKRSRLNRGSPKRLHNRNLVT